MKKQTYIKRMDTKLAQFRTLWYGMVALTNEYIESNPKNKSEYPDFWNTPIEKLVDEMALNAGWIHDRLDGFTPVLRGDAGRGSLIKRIRKALGFDE